MNSFIFVSVICTAQACAFMTSPDFISEKECAEYKQEFTKQQFTPQVSLAAYQCMEFNPKGRI